MDLSATDALFFVRAERLRQQLQNFVKLRALLFNFLFLFILPGQKMGG